MATFITDIIQKVWYVNFRHTRKNSHLAFYLRSFARYYTPKCITQRCLRRRLAAFQSLGKEEQDYITSRIDYYCKFSDSIQLPEDAPLLKDFTFRNRSSYVHDYVNSTYFFDAYEYTRYFPDSMRWAYNPGDVNYIFPLPEITKSRPITSDDGNRNNILLKLDKVRHFLWVTDPFKWEEKKCMVLFRGDARCKPRRLKFIEMWKDHPWCDLASTGKKTLYGHLYYKYIMCLEGNDVASNLKWVMSSNSVAVMPRPTCETWFMEGKLIPNYHYIEIADDYHDLIERITYYEEHPEEAKEIVRHAHEWVRQFQDRKREDLISLMVLDRYFNLTGQKDCKDTMNNNSRKYFVNDRVKLNTSQKLNAQSKARADILRTFTELGYTTYNITNHKYSFGKDKRYHHYPLFSKTAAKIQGALFTRKVKAGDTVVIQDFHLKHMQKIATECIKKGAKVIFLIHDVQCLRFNKTTSEIRKLNNASLLLVHTDSMKRKLTDMGVKTPMKVMQVFDYYSTDPMLDDNILNQKNDIVFAGNLQKSEFLSRISEHDIGNFRLHLYGILGGLNLNNNPAISYRGVFQSDNTAAIHGGWGLVWDGDSTDSCTGDYGNYLRYNTSHKIALYLACGMPLIVWTESAVAPWVSSENIGITVSSMKDAVQRINALTDDEYHAMVTNARRIGSELRNGNYLKRILTNL